NEMPTLTTANRVLRSGLVDLLVGPHGVDRYLELIRPELTVRDARARVVAVEHQTERSVTLTLRPNAAWSGFRAGQFIRVGGEIAFIHYARTAGDWLYRDEVERLARRHRNVSFDYLATREGGAYVTRKSIESQAGAIAGAQAAVCGPPGLIEAVRDIWPDPER